MGKIRINNMSFHTFNGVFPEEKKLGQRLEVDVEMSYPIEQKVIDDNLAQTISYADVYEMVAEFVMNNNYNLIESVANQILQLILTNNRLLTAAVVRVRKYSVPIAGIFDNIEIEVEGFSENG